MTAATTAPAGTVLYPHVPEWAHLTVPGVTIVVPPDASREVWEEARNDGVGGSDVASIAGIGYDSPYTVWAKKTGRPVEPFSQEAEDRMRWGHLLEPLIRDEFQWQHPEYLITPTPGTLAMTGMEWIRVNVDGLVWHRDGTLAAVLECKSGSHRQLQHWRDEDEVPVSHTAQVQWAMLITGAPCAWVTGLLDTNQYLERIIVRDDELIADLVPVAAEFWANVAADVPPPVDGSDSTRETLARIEARAGSKVSLDPRVWAPRFARIHAINAEIRALKAEKEAIANLARFAMGEHTIAELDGQKVATHTPIKPSRSCRYDRLLAGWPDAYDACVVESEPDPDVPPARKFDVSRSRDALALLDTYTTTAMTRNIDED